MNWLAHIVLAGPDADDQLGGVLADLVPMSVARTLPAGLRRGVALHLSVDAFSDAHMAVAASVRRISMAGVGLRPAAAAIAVDMLYDHLLARGWDQYGPTGDGLEAFASAFYEMVSAHPAPLPERARQVLAAMSMQDWLGAYRLPGEIRLALKGIRRRLSPRAAALCPLANAVDVFEAEPAGFEEDFARFWPEVVCHAKTVRAAAEIAPANDL